VDKPDYRLEMVVIKKENKILIITGGRTEEEFLSKLLKTENFTLIIVADSGLVLADRLKIMPDYIVGDFDSVQEAVLDRYRNQSTPIKTFPKEKDKTDTQIAIELALKLSPSSVTIVGATGSRMDHTLANIHLLLLFLQNKVEAFIVDQNNKLYLKQESFFIEKSAQYGDYVSLLPFGEAVKGLTLKGFYYPLDSVILSAGSSLGISNEIVEDIARVEFREGIVLVMETRD
jgi:thiamine pyrophosphokinase